MPQILPPPIVQLAFPLIPSPGLSLFAPSGIQRHAILNRVQSHAMVSQAWTDWALVSPAVYSSSLVGLAQIQALLNVAQGLYPTSPPVLVAQQVITSRQPPALPQPPAPPAPGTRQPTMPLRRIMPAPGSPFVPRTLNEVTYNTATATPHIGNQPGGRHQMPPPNGIEDVDRRPPGESFLATIQRDSTRITTESDSRLTVNSRTSAIFPALAGSGRCSPGGTTTWGQTNASDDESDASAEPASRSTRAPSDYATGVGGQCPQRGVVEEAAKDKGGRL